MKRRTLCSYGIAPVVAAILAFGSSAPGLAQALEGVELSGAVAVSAEVVGIDRADRIVTVRGPRGNIVAIEAPEDVQNFENIALGDKLKIEYYESVALYLGAPGSQPAVGAAEVVGRRADGEKPGDMVLDAIDVSATVKGMDKATREITLALPNGNIVTNKVDPSVSAFDDLKVGDSIHARLTRAVAISVDAP